MAADSDPDQRIYESIKVNELDRVLIRCALLAWKAGARGPHATISKFLNNAEDTNQLVSSDQHRYHFGLESKLDKFLEVQVGESELHVQGYISLSLLAIEFKVPFQCLAILCYNNISHVSLLYKTSYLCIPNLRLVPQIFISY